MVIGLKRSIAVIAAVTIFSVAYATDFSVSPGNLGKILDSHKVIEDGVITLKGKIDARDIFALRKLPDGVNELNLSGVSVSPYSTPDVPFEGKVYYPGGVIPEYSMFGIKVKRLSLPNNIVEIEQGGLAGSAIESVTLPETLTTIGNYAFYDCQDLKEIKFPSKLTSVGESSFGSCVALKTISLSSTEVRAIPKWFLRGCTSLEGIVLPQGLSEIGQEAFAGTAIASITIENVGIASPYSLSGMRHLKAVTLSGNGDVPQGLLMGDVSLESIKGTPADVPALFVAGCPNLDVTELVRNAMSLGSFSLAGGTEKKLVFGAELKRVDTDVFTGLSSLSVIDATSLTGDIPEVDEGSFDAIHPEEISLYVKPDNLDKWVEHPEWGKFKIVKTDSSTEMFSLEKDVMDISCRQNGNCIEVKACIPINQIEVYSVDGRVIARSNPESDHASVDVDLSGESVVVVRIDTPSIVKIFKLAVNK